MISGVFNNTQSLQTQFSRNVERQNGILQRLATGRRINSGKDDPAGLISATQLESAIAALEAESRAVQRVNTRVNIADGHATQLTSMMSDLRGLAVASANTAGMSDDEIAANQLQMDSIAANIQQYAQDFVGSLEGVNLPDGGNEELAEQITAAAASVASLVSGGDNDLSSGNFDAIQDVIDQAGATFAEARGTIGAYQKYTLELRQSSISAERESLLAAHSQIVDVDYAEETSKLAMSQVAVAASAEVLRIANHNNQLVLGLLS